jgi:hypothetical protein
VISRQALSRRDAIGVGAGMLAIPGSPLGIASATIVEIPTLKALRDLAAPSSASVAFVLGHSAPLDFGGGWYWWDSASTSVDDGGAVIQPAGGPARGRWRLRHDGSLHVAQFGAVAGASAATTTRAIEAAMRLVLAEGGEVVFQPRATYPIERVLDLRNADVQRRNYPRSIRGNGATLDFSRSGLRSGALVRIGAAQPEHGAETMWSNVNDLLIRGPEDQDRIEPRHTGHRADARAATDRTATTVVGLSLEHAVRVNLRNIHVSHCHRGVRYRRCWGGVYENVQATKCIVGHHVDDGCTHVTFMKAQATSCTVGYLIRPEPPAVAVGVVTMLTPLAEDCTVAFHLDQNSSSGAAIDSVRIVDPYLEDIYGDAFRVGIAFDASPGRWSVAGADRLGKIASFQVDGGRFAGDGATASYGPARRAFRFASRPNVASCRLLFPCARADIVNLPPHATFQSLARAEDVGNQRIDFEFPGFGLALVDGRTGTALFRSGNIAGVARLRSGVYDLHFGHAYASRNAAIPVVMARETGYVASMDVANSTTGSARVELRNASGVLADGGFQVVLHGVLAPL